MLFVEDDQLLFEHIYRIALQAILISLDELKEKYIKNFVLPVYGNSKIVIQNTVEDYFIIGWNSPTTGILIQTPMIYIENKN
ncbi:MAG: hypothetical protein QNJ74_02015 [Trichodesmium sp. MO_231.B1]|nr:hypothetical protein [Trichodesmium sp. MO_231.B1]